jgi:hypothetical protein
MGARTVVSAAASLGYLSTLQRLAVPQVGHDVDATTGFS